MYKYLTSYIYRKRESEVTTNQYHFLSYITFDRLVIEIERQCQMMLTPLTLLMMSWNIYLLCVAFLSVFGCIEWEPNINISHCYKQYNMNAITLIFFSISQKNLRQTYLFAFLLFFCVRVIITLWNKGQKCFLLLLLKSQIVV
jgi:hypothetical protein